MMHEVWLGKVMSHHMILAEYLTKRQKRGGGGGFSADLLALSFCQLNTVVFRFIRKSKNFSMSSLVSKYYSLWISNKSAYAVGRI